MEAYGGMVIKIIHSHKPQPCGCNSQLRDLSSEDNT